MRTQSACALLLLTPYLPDLGLPDDDYWQGSDDESSGLSSYGDEDSSDEGAGRKISSGSQDSASSGKVTNQTITEIGRLFR